jgi:hypothetical protein
MVVAWLLYQTEGLTIDDGSATGQLGWSNSTRSGVSDFQTEQVSHFSMALRFSEHPPPHGRQVAEDRNEPDMLRRSSRLGQARPRVGSLLLMNVIFRLDPLETPG